MEKTQPANGNLLIQNDGHEIAYTNFWDMTKLKGFLLLSWSDDIARFLISKQHEYLVSQGKNANLVIISKPKYTEPNKMELMEIRFDNYPRTSFSINIPTNYSDKPIAELQHGDHFTIALWTKDGKQCEIPGRFRLVDSLPCLDRWVEH